MKSPLPQDCQTAMLKLAQEAMNGKAKPPGSLGLLENWAIKLSVLQHCLQPTIAAARLLVFAADHGITSSTPGVSAYPREVSVAIFAGIASGGGASAVLCAANDCSLNLIDVGIDANVESISGCASNSSATPCVVVTHAKVRRGSRDMLAGPAMTPDESEAAHAAGAHAVDRFVAEHAAAKPAELVLCVGELGIGNTTAASALTAALTGKPAEEVCGRGTGLDDAGLALKVAKVKAAITQNSALITTGPEGTLQAVGGLEIAAMVGAYCRAAELRMPVLVDGFISAAAALVACRLDPSLRSCMFWSHRSEEQGAAAVLEGVGEKSAAAAAAGSARPPLEMRLRLGEGTGAVLAVPLLRSAAAVMTHMASLKEIIDGSS